MSDVRKTHHYYICNSWRLNIVLRTNVPTWLFLVPRVFSQSPVKETQRCTVCVGAGTACDCGACLTHEADSPVCPCWKVPVQVSWRDSAPPRRDGVSGAVCGAGSWRERWVWTAARPPGSQTLQGSRSDKQKSSESPSITLTTLYVGYGCGRMWRCVVCLYVQASASSSSLCSPRGHQSIWVHAAQWPQKSSVWCNGPTLPRWRRPTCSEIFWQLWPRRTWNREPATKTHNIDLDSSSTESVQPVLFLFIHDFAYIHFRYIYPCCPHHSGRQIESSTVQEVSSREKVMEAPGGSETPEVTEQSVKGTRNGAEGPGALCKQKIPSTGQRHQQDQTWKLGQYEGESVSGVQHKFLTKSTI